MKTYRHDSKLASGLFNLTGILCLKIDEPMLFALPMISLLPMLDSEFDLHLKTVY